MSTPRKSDREIFEEALEIPDAAERAALVDRHCSGTPGQRERVLDLLDALEQADDFLRITRGDPEEQDRQAPVATRLARPTEQGPGSIIGNYKLLQEIGEGGFGVVYMAEQFQPVKRKVALKIIKPGMDTREVVARFEAERQALALMVHPNIAQVLDAGATESGRPYFVMELVKGIPITEFCDKNRLPTFRRLHLFLDICGAVQHAHQKGVVHRDLKPSNILVTLHDGVPVPKVIDFGIAKALNQELTEKTLFTAYGQMIGTPQYMSPEQAEMSGLDIDTRSDIYSLGVLLYELLIGETPLSRKELCNAGYNEMQKLIREKEPTKPSMAVGILCLESTTIADFRQEKPAQLIDAMKGDLDWIVLKALEKDRTRRYETANGLAQDIRRYLNHEPVTASPPTMGYLLGKFARRHRPLITALAAVFMALLLGAVGMSLLYLEAREDRRVAEQQSEFAESARKSAEQARAAETEQRRLAQRNAGQLRHTLSRADLVLGTELLERDQDREALTHLARALRTDETFLPAAQVLLSALRDRNSNLDPEITLSQEKPLSAFSLNQRDGSLLTRATDGTARIWDSATWKLRREFGGESPLRSASFSPDGRHLVTLESNGTIRAWNMRMLTPQGSPIIPEGGAREFKLASGPEGDLVIATRSNHEALQAWNGITGQPMTKPVTLGEGLEVAEFQLNDDGTRLLGRFGDQWVGCWDTPSGQPTGNPIEVAQSRFVAISLAGRKLCRVNEYGTLLTLHDLESGETTGELGFEDGVVTQPLISPSGTRMITQSRLQLNPSAPRRIHFHPVLISRVIDLPTATVIGTRTDINTALDAATPRYPLVHAASGTSLLRTTDFNIRVTNLRTAEDLLDVELDRRLAAANNDAEIMVFSPSGDRFAVKFHDRRFGVYNTLTGQRAALSRAEAAPFQSIEFTPDGQRLVTKNGKGVARIWDAATARPISAPLRHAMFVGRILFTPDGHRMISQDHSGAGNKVRRSLLKVWDIRDTRARFEPLPLPPLAPVQHLDSVDPSLVLTTRSGEILVLDIGTREVTDRLAVAGKPLRQARIHRVTGRIAAIGGKEVLLWNPGSREPGLSLPHENEVRGAWFSPEGTRLITADAGAAVRVWDAGDGSPVTDSLSAGNAVRQAGIGPDGKRLFVTTSEGGLVWNLASPGPNAFPERIPHTDAGDGPAIFSPAGNRAVTLAANTADVWDAHSGRHLASLDHNANLKAAWFSPDGSRLLVIGPDVAPGTRLPGFAILWELASGKRLLELTHDRAFLEARFGPDETVITLDANHSLQVWHAATGQPLAQPMNHNAGVDSFGLTRNGEVLASVSDGRLRLRPMPPNRSPAPEWLADLAEGVAGQRLDQHGHIEPLPPEALKTLRQGLNQQSGEDEYSRFARWFAMDPATRPLDPDTSVTGAGFVRQALERADPEQLRHALRLYPGNADLYARLAEVVPPGPEAESLPWQRFPDWYLWQAVE